MLRAHNASPDPLLTDHADMSLFAFIRRFRDEVGTIPGHRLIRPARRPGTPLTWRPPTGHRPHRPPGRFRHRHMPARAPPRRHRHLPHVYRRASHPGRGRGRRLGLGRGCVNRGSPNPSMYYFSRLFRGFRCLVRGSTASTKEQSRRVWPEAEPQVRLVHQPGSARLLSATPT